MKVYESKFYQCWKNFVINEAGEYSMTGGNAGELTGRWVRAEEWIKENISAFDLASFDFDETLTLPRAAQLHMDNDPMWKRQKGNLQEGDDPTKPYDSFENKVESFSDEKSKFQDQFPVPGKTLFQPTVDILKMFQSAGKRVIITTLRSPSFNDKHGDERMIQTILSKAGIKIDFVNDLIFTDGQAKSPHILREANGGSAIHFDDDKKVILDCLAHGIEAIWLNKDVPAFFRNGED